MKKKKVSCFPIGIEKIVLSDEFKKLLFESFDEYMEERDKLRQVRYTVNIIGSEKNKDKAWEVLERCGATFHCIEDEGYIINGLQKKSLDRVGVKYKIK